VRLFAAVLLLWLITEAVEAGGAYPPLLIWALWTSALFLCGAASWADVYLTLTNRVAGLAAYTMLTVYYITMQAEYLQFIPSDADYPDLWPTLYMVINLVSPIGLVTVGILRMAVQRGGDEY